MESFSTWSTRADAWLAEDHRLLTEDAGWTPRLTRSDLSIWSRKTPDDDNDLFRWRLPVVAANIGLLYDVHNAPSRFSRSSSNGSRTSASTAAVTRRSSKPATTSTTNERR